MTTRTLTVALPGSSPLALTVDDRGEGRPFLLLHGGGGPQTVAGFAELLATQGPARVITPVHPGFGIIRPQANGPVISRQRLVPPIKRLQNNAPAVPHFGKLRRDRQRLFH